MKAKENLVKQLAESFSLYIKSDSPVLAACDFGKKRVKPTKAMTQDFLEKFGQSEATFSENIDTAKLSEFKTSKKKVDTFDQSMVVLVKNAVNIAQPLIKQQIDDTEESFN